MGTTSNTVEHLLNEKDVARITGMSLAWVRKQRLQGKGPVFLKVGGSAVRYRPSDLSAYLESRPTGGGGRGEAGA